MRDRNSSIPLETKIKDNIWDSIEDVADVIVMSRKGEWSWASNPECKYITVRIDMRDGGCIINNDEGKRIDPKELKFQYESKYTPQFDNGAMQNALEVKSDTKIVDVTPTNKEERDCDSCEHDGECYETVLKCKGYKKVIISKT